MIPTAYLVDWSTKAPWPDFRQVEQDLIICRALCDLFNNETLKNKLAFRGGTAIHKLLFDKPLRYSEDIDLVQTKGEPIKETVAQIGAALAWLGECKYAPSMHSVHLEFKFTPDADSQSVLRLKVEINTREHNFVDGLTEYPFEVNNGWYQAQTKIVSFGKEEVFGTKLRALLQRQKNRDLFDLNEGLRELKLIRDKVVQCLVHYLGLEKHSVTRANAEERMLRKLNKSLTEDIVPLLPVGITFTDDQAIEAFGLVWGELIRRIPGEPWKSAPAIIKEIRKTKIPNLLQGIED